jgi:hypothetical protein
MEFSFLTRADIAKEENITPSQLQAAFSDKRCPQLTPVHRLGIQLLYSPADVEEWRPKFRAWRAAAPARTAAQRLSLEKAWAAKSEKAMAQWAEVKPEKATQ